jgi:transcriptional regulator
MYVPRHFAHTSLPDLHAFMGRYSFATLVTAGSAGQLTASHIPLLLDPAVGPNGCLFGHVARANDQWRYIGGEALAIFTGPHAYVSPRWYEADEVVPTWNYVAVHAYGPLEAIEDPAELKALLLRMIEVYEAGAESPWTLERSGAAVDKLLGAIAGFRIPIVRLEGKWKLSQNHPPGRQAKVIAALEAQGDANSLAVAALMRQNLTS